MDNDNNDSNFTFCQVGLPTDQNGVEAKNVAADVGVIAIEDEFSSSSDSSKNGGFLWKDKQPNNATLANQATVGSLTFNVIEASCTKPSGESSSQVASGDVGAPGKNAEKPKISTRNPASPTKVPFEKGYSQMDWLKLTQTHPDLSGVDTLMKPVGKDCTSLFNKYHAWVNAEFLLEKCLVGTFADNEGSNR